MRARSILLYLLAACLCGCQTPGQGRDPGHIRIVSSLPLTGSSRVQSETMVKGIQMALDDAHYKAGPFTIDYSSWDDASAQAGSWDPAKENENAKRASADPDVMAYIGTYNSGAAKIAIPILNRADLVMVCPAASYSGLTKPGLGEKGEPEIYYPREFRNFCRVIPADDLQGMAAAWWTKSLGVHKVYILDDKELYGRGLARVFEEDCRRRGLQVMGHEGIDSKAPDYRSVMNKVKDSGAELIYFGGITQNGAGKLVKDMKEVGLTTRFMSPDGTKEDAFLKAAGSASEGCLVTLGGLPPEQMGPEAQDWYRRYRERYKSEPEAYSIYSYEATRVTLQGIERAGVKDRVKIRQAIMGTKNYHGLLGEWSFDARGDTTISSISGFEVKDGKFVFSQALKPGDAALTPSVGNFTSQASRVQSGGAGLLLEQLLTGLANGSLIAIVALGYTLVYGLVELINFAHGDVFMMGSFAALSSVSLLGLTNRGPAGTAMGLLLVLLISMGFSGILNALIDRVAYSRLRNAPRLVPLIAAIGVSFILMNLGGYWKGWAPINFPNMLGSADRNLFGEGAAISFRLSQLLVILIALPLLGALHVFIYGTRLGKAMRATAQNPDAARLMGIDTDRVISLAFLIGGALAGAAGFLYGLYNHEVRFDLGFRQGLNAFTAAVLGGIGNVRGAVLGGLIIGLVEALTTYYLTQALAPAVVFGVLILIIVFKPSGLLGENVPEKV